MEPLGDCRVEMGVSAILTPRLDLTTYKLKDECSREMLLSYLFPYCCEYSFIRDSNISRGWGDFFGPSSEKVVLTNGYPYPGFYLVFAKHCILPCFVSGGIAVGGHSWGRRVEKSAVPVSRIDRRGIKMGQPSIAVRRSTRIAG